MFQVQAFVYSQPFFVLFIKRDVSFQTDESKLSDFELIKAYDIHMYYKGGGVVRKCSPRSYLHTLKQLLESCDILFHHSM